MSLAPIPPIVYGPVYPISPSLHLGGVFSGSVVTIDGSISGILATITYNGRNTEPWLPFAREPVEGEYIIVEQTSLKGLNSGKSSLRAVQVTPIPNPLPCPIIIQPLHNCSNIINLGGLIPGARITVQVHGTKTVDAVIERPSQAFQLDPLVSFGPGDIFTVFQSAILHDRSLPNCITRSLPVEDLGLHNPLPLPLMKPSPRACTSNATFEGLVTGASLSVANEGRSYWAGGVSGGTQEISWADFNLPWLKGPITAEQAFPRCNLTSDISTDLVLPADPLKPPVLTNGLCIQSTSIHLSGLNVPSELQVQRLVSGHPELTQLRNIPINQVNYEMPIPDDWPLIDSNGAVSFQFLQKTGCGTSPWSPSLYINMPISAIEKPTILPPLYECSRFITIQHATPICQMYASTVDGTPLSANFTVMQSDFFLHTDALYHPLVENDKVQLIQFGCGRDWESDAVSVLAVPPELPAPSLPALRPGDQFMKVGDVIPGASVFAIVDGQRFYPVAIFWTADFEAVTTEVTLQFSKPLVLNQKVLAIQELCGNYSSLDSHPATVSLAQLVLTVTPSVIVKGQQAVVRVDAVDNPTATKNSPLWGPVSLNGVTFALGQPTAITVSATDSRSSLQVIVAGTSYNAPASFTISLREPPPPTFTLQLIGTPKVFLPFVPRTGQLETVIIQAIEWTAVPRWVPSARRTLNGAQPPGQNFMSATTSFDRPPASEVGVSDIIDVTGKATFFITNINPPTGSITLTGRIQAPPTTASKSCIGWLLSFQVDVSGILLWDNGQIGFDPLVPFSFSC
jgi:hypothetical protein